MSKCSNCLSDGEAPKQDRSRRTYDLILIAAERLFIQKGWDSLTTNAVAEAAGVSIGSLYRYFPDKSSIVRALAERAARPGLERMDALLAEPMEALDLGAAMERLLVPDPRGIPDGSLCLGRLRGPRCSDELDRIAADLEKEIEERLAGLVARFLPGIEPEAARVKAKLVRGLALAASAEAEREGTLAPAIYAETTRLLRACLSDP
jgi:AcrR family transcriptional regulator